MIQVMSGSKRGTQLFSVMQRGDLVPHEVVLDILAQKMVETVAGANGFLIDGFPLDMEEANAFEKQIVPVTRWDIYCLRLYYFDDKATMTLKG